MSICLKGGKSRILANGNPEGTIFSKRGLRQGDPLSPLIFVLAAVLLTRMLNLAVSNDVLEEVGPAGFHKMVSLQNVDDTLLFCKSDDNTSFL